MKKGIVSLISIGILLLIATILLIIFFSFIKDTNEDVKRIKLEEGSKIYFVYDKVNEEFLQEYKNFCQKESLKCIFVNKNDSSTLSSITYKDYLILLGAKTDPSKYILGIVEYPKYFTDFEEVPPFITIDDSGGYVKISNSYLTSIENVKLKIVSNSSQPYKLLFSFDKQGIIKVCLNDTCNNYIKLDANNQQLSYNLNGKSKTYSIILKDKKNIFSISITKNYALIKVNTDTYVVDNLALNQLFDHIELGNVKLDKLGYFIKNLPKGFKNMILLSDTLSGENFANMIITYNFLPYLKEPHSYNIKVSLSNMMEEDGHLENFKYFIQHVRNHYFPEYQADMSFSLINLLTNHKCIIVSNYEDLRGKSYIGFFYYNNKRYLIKTILQNEGKIPIRTRNGVGYISYTTFVGGQPFYSVPLSKPELTISLCLSSS